MRALRLPARRLVRSPLYSLATCAVLALAGAALTATGMVAYGILIAPPPYESPSELVFLERLSQRTGANINFTPVDYRRVEEGAKSFEVVGAAGAWDPVLSLDDSAERLRALRVSGDLFALLGQPALLGRVLEPDDDRVDAQPTAVISTRLARRLFGEEGDAVGRELRLDGEIFDVVGVMPSSFEFPTFWRTGVDVWVPIRLDPESIFDRSSAWLRVFGRLRDGATLQQAGGEMEAIGDGLRAQFPDTHADLVFDVLGLQDAAVRGLRPALTALAAGAALLWLLAIANLASLAVVRSGGRRTEAAVRRALGESFGRGFRLHALESGLLALVGSAAGTALGYAAIRIGAATAPGQLQFLMARWDEMPVGAWLLVATAAPAFAATLALAAASLVALVGPPLADRLRARSDAGGSRGAAALRGVLTGGEIALAVILLAAAGLVGRSLFELSSVDPGFRAARVTTAVVPVTGTASGDESRKAGFYRALLDRLSTTPGVESAALVNHIPLKGDRWGLPFSIDGEPPPPPDARSYATYRVATPEYLETIGAQLITGRPFSTADSEDAPPVVHVNESFARRHLGGVASALDERIRIGREDGPLRRVVGVVADLQQERWAKVEPEVFLPFEQDASFRDSPRPPFAMTVVVRSESETAAAQIRNAVADLDPTVPVDNIVSLAAAVDDALWQPRLTASLMEPSLG